MDSNIKGAFPALIKIRSVRILIYCEASPRPYINPSKPNTIRTAAVKEKLAEGVAAFRTIVKCD